MHVIYRTTNGREERCDIVRFESCTTRDKQQGNNDQISCIFTTDLHGKTQKVKYCSMGYNNIKFKILAVTIHKF